MPQCLKTLALVQVPSLRRDCNVSLVPSLRRTNVNSDWIMASPKKLVAITDMRAKSKSLDDSQARDATPTAFSEAEINFGVKPNGAECKTGANN